MAWSFKNARGQQLFAQCILPDKTDEIKACVVFCHGYAEHSSRKLPAFKQLAAAGIAVYAFDMAGFGRSEPTEPAQRALIWNYQDLVDDLCQFAQLARTTHGKKGYPAVPWFLSGFSLGGLTAAHAVLRKQQAWAGLVLVSACMWVHMTWVTQLQRLVAPILNYACPAARIVQQLDPSKDLNPDPEQVQDYVNDPLVYHHRTAVTTAVQLGEAVWAMRDVRSQLELPVYAVHATQDAITPYRDMKEFFEATSSTNKHLKTIEGGYHDLIGGADTQQHVDDIIDWLLKTAA